MHLPSRGADVLRASKLHQVVQRTDSDGYLGRTASVRMRTQGTGDDALEPPDVCLDEAAPVAARHLLSAYASALGDGPKV